jgi:hypothetical protein
MANTFKTTSSKPMIFAFVENKPDNLYTGFSAILRKKYPDIYRVNIGRGIKDVKYSIIIYFYKGIDYDVFKNITDDIILQFQGNLNVFYKSKNEPVGVKYTYSNINQVERPDVPQEKIAFIKDDDETVVDVSMTTSKPISTRKMKVISI